MCFTFFPKKILSDYQSPKKTVAPPVFVMRSSTSPKPRQTTDAFVIPRIKAPRKRIYDLRGLFFEKILKSGRKKCNLWEFFFYLVNFYGAFHRYLSFIYRTIEKNLRVLLPSTRCTLCQNSFLKYI